MKIKSSKKKTRHILVRVTPYLPFGEEDEFMEFGFLYFENSHRVEEDVKTFHKNWKTKKLRVSRFPVEINNAILLKSSAIENVNNVGNPDYKYIKFDSLNYLKHEPVFDECDTYYRIPATILCYFDYFQIEVERIPEGHRLPWIIYKTGANYTKLINYSSLKAR